MKDLALSAEVGLAEPAVPAMHDGDVTARAPIAKGDGRITEGELVDALRRGDEDAFRVLIERHGALMLRVAGSYVRGHAVADEVVQETWLSVLTGIDRFEQRSSLRTWIFSILVNTAKSRGVRERRNVPLSALEGAGVEPTVEPERFLDENHDRWPGRWSASPSSWTEIPERRLLSRETLDYLRDAIEMLPERQRVVVVMRDVEDWSPGEVCAALAINDGNQRVLLHRARSQVRRKLECYFAT